MNPILTTLLYEWRDRELPALIPRNIKLDTEKRPGDNNATVITGFRRVGKTYIVFEAVERLLKQYPREEVIYLNFEDERLPLQIETLTDLLPTIQAAYGTKPKYLFLDELQVIPAWSKWVRRILDSESIQLFITGSNSKMGSRELPTELRGRAWEVLVSPLTFAEFLRFKQTTIDTEKMAFVAEEQARFSYLFDEYLTYGALPAVVLAEHGKKQELLQSYFQTVVQSDIAERNKIRNDAGLRALLRLLLNSTLVTVSKLHGTLKSMGNDIGKSTVDNYLHYAEEAYFLEQLFIFNASVVNQLQYPRKVYFIDTGFITALSTKFSTNKGRLFENVIYNRLMRQYDTLHYYRYEQGQEVDFVVLEDGAPTVLYQVCYDLSNEETRDREVKALVKAGKRLNCTNLKLITLARNTNQTVPPEIEVVSADRVIW